MDKKEGNIKQKSLKQNIILLIIFIAVILLVVLIIHFQNKNNLTEEDFKCIAGKSELYVLKTCSHCAEQKQLLGDYLSYFTIIDCSENTQKCTDLGITRVPTWIINNQIYTGLKTLNELKNLAGC